MIKQASKEVPQDVPFVLDGLVIGIVSKNNRVCSLVESRKTGFDTADFRLCSFPRKSKSRKGL